MLDKSMFVLNMLSPENKDFIIIILWPIWLLNGCRVNSDFMLTPGSRVYSRFG